MTLSLSKTQIRTLHAFLLLIYTIKKILSIICLIQTAGCRDFKYVMFYLLEKCKQKYTELSKCLLRDIYPLSFRWIEFLKDILRGFGDSGNINTNTWNFKYIVGRSKYEKMSTSPFALSAGFQHESSFSYISNLSFKVWNSITFFSIPVSSF